MLSQRLVGAAHGPDVVSRDLRHSVQDCKARSRRVRTGDNAPLLPIPVFDQWQATGASAEGLSDGPDVVSRDFRHSVQDCNARPRRVRTGDNAPLLPIPVFDQWQATGAVLKGSHGPDIMGGNLGDRTQTASAPWRVRTGDNPPVLPIPVLDQGLSGAPHGPDIVGRDLGHPAQESVVSRCWVRTGNDAPRSAIPVLNERLFNARALQPLLLLLLGAERQTRRRRHTKTQVL